MQGGSRIPRRMRHQPSIDATTYEFAKISKKTAWNWEYFESGGVCAPRSATKMYQLIMITDYKPFWEEKKVM